MTYRLAAGRLEATGVDLERWCSIELAILRRIGSLSTTYVGTLMVMEFPPEHTEVVQAVLRGRQIEVEISEVAS